MKKALCLAGVILCVILWSGVVLADPIGEPGLGHMTTPVITTTFIGK